jgi:hypothetical protein
MALSILAKCASLLPYLTADEELMARYNRATDFTKRGLPQRSHAEMTSLSNDYVGVELQSIPSATLKISKLIVIYNLLEGRGCDADAQTAFEKCTALMATVCGTTATSVNTNNLFMGWLFYLMGITSMKVGKEGMHYLKTAADVHKFNGAEYSLGVFLYNGDDLAGKPCKRDVKGAKRYLKAASAENDLAKDALVCIAEKSKRLKLSTAQ